MRWKVLAAPLAAVLFLGNWSAAAGAAAGTPARTAPRVPTGTLTLVTGDRVEVTDAGAVRLHPGPGRERVGFVRSGNGAGLTVIPLDAQPLIAQKRVDRRLFEVGRLLEAGYGDARTRELPLTVAGGQKAAVPKSRAAAFWDATLAGTRKGPVAFAGTVRPRPAPRVRAAATEHSLKVEVLGRDGRPADVWWQAENLDVPYADGYGASGESVRLGAGRYAVSAVVVEDRPGEPEPRVSMLMNPDLRLDGDTTLTLDARQAERVRFTPADRPTARDGVLSAIMRVKAAPGLPWEYSTRTVIVGAASELYAATTGSSSGLLFGAGGVLVEPLIRLDVAGPRPFPVDARYLAGELPGVHRLPAVHGDDSGGGANAEGALVVLDAPEEDDARLPDRVARAAASGARAVLLVRDGRAPKLGAKLPVPVLFGTTSAAARLRDLADAGPVRVTTRGIEASPYQYNLFHHTMGQVPDRADYRVHDRELGMSRADYRAPGGPFSTVLQTTAEVDGHGFGSPTFALRLPATRTEYFSTGPGLRFQRVVLRDHYAAPVLVTRRAYRAGEHVNETMYRGVLGPTFAPPAQDAGRPAWAYRKGDELNMAVPAFGDADGHLGVQDPEAGGDVRLYRDGELLGSSGRSGEGAFTVPAAPGEYRMEADAKVDVPGWEVSTAVQSAWTFRSARTDAAVPLPLMAVRYAPALAEGRAPAGRRFAIPVRVERQPGSGEARIKALTVEASFDDGAHWQRIRVRAVGDHWRAYLRNPEKGHVSLRATAEGSDGATVTQTILRAYLVG
ncbi:hypothetical protein HUT06_39080 [Actinomadura sp. NAK00032]|uniref:hypothetical protein n=1 Tax=Actinomadura sp. NAK00032 TaxID=2742128 RepID=UPI0015929147|nr:hypothetical protein [Actinomadura sp. NAK00032]QKW39301.1 hypothetical protein HUT06_39080 [Actinomadura sp. NAK00032]